MTWPGVDASARDDDAVTYAPVATTRAIPMVMFLVQAKRFIGVARIREGPGASMVQQGFHVGHRRINERPRCVTFVNQQSKLGAAQSDDVATTRTTVIGDFQKRTT